MSRSFSRQYKLLNRLESYHHQGRVWNHYVVPTRVYCFGMNWTVFVRFYACIQFWHILARFFRFEKTSDFDFVFCYALIYDAQSLLLQSFPITNSKKRNKYESYYTNQNKTPGQIYVDLKTPFLHGNNSEFGAKNVDGPYMTHII